MLNPQNCPPPPKKHVRQGGPPPAPLEFKNWYSAKLKKCDIKINGGRGILERRTTNLFYFFQGAGGSEAPF